MSYVIKIEQNELNVIVQALGEIPLKIGYNLLVKLENQIKEQDLENQITEENL